MCSASYYDIPSLYTDWPKRSGKTALVEKTINRPASELQFSNETRPGSYEKVTVESKTDFHYKKTLTHYAGTDELKDED